MSCLAAFFIPPFPLPVAIVGNVTMLLYSNPETSLVCQSIASPSTNMLSCRLASGCFCFYTHNTIALKSLSGKITSNTNLTLSLEFDGHAGVPRDKVSG